MAFNERYGKLQGGIGDALYRGGRFLGRSVMDQFAPFAPVLPEWENAPPPQIGQQPPPRPAIESAALVPAQPQVPGNQPDLSELFAMRMPTVRPIEESLRERQQEEDAQRAAERRNARVSVTVDGKTYDYANGAEGGAPMLAGDAGPGAGQGFGRTWNSPRGGSFTMLQDNPNLTPERSIEAALRERDLADIQPAPGRLGEFGVMRGEARPIEAAIYQKEREASAGTRARTEAEKELIRERTQAELGKQGAISEGYAKDAAAIDAEEQEQLARLAAYNLPPEDRKKREDVIREIADERRQRVKESYGFGGRLTTSSIYGG